MLHHVRQCGGRKDIGSREADGSAICILDGRQSPKIAPICTIPEEHLLFALVQPLVDIVRSENSYQEARDAYILGSEIVVIVQRQKKMNFITVEDVLPSAFQLQINLRLTRKQL